jgi:hypothetical protein
MQLSFGRKSAIVFASLALALALAPSLASAPALSDLQDRNNLEVADVIIKWIDEHVEKKN